MIFTMHRQVSLSVVLASVVACSTVRTERSSGVSAAADAAAPSERTAATPEAGAAKKADASKAKGRDVALCELIANRLRLAAAWRARPGDLFGSKAMLCGQYTPAHVCSRTGGDDDGFIGVGFSTAGPGALFHFQLAEEEGPKTRVTCRTLGLSGAKDLGRGVERCAMVGEGALANMTIIVDSRCDRLRLTVFDSDYLAQDPSAADVAPCEEPSPGRLAAPPLSCGSVATIHDKK